MKKYKAVISDVDGTLTAISPHALPSDKVTQAIKKLFNKNIVFSLATGRPFPMIKNLVKLLNLNSPMIADNGAVIINAKDNSVLWESLLPNREANEIINFTKKYKLTRVSCDSINLENPRTIPKEAKIRKISVHDLTYETANNLINLIENKYKNLAIMKAASYEGNEFVDIYFSHAQATKQHAVVKYAEILGISTDEIIGIGDGYNDYPLLMACGVKVAMGNAVKELKEIADFVAPSVADDGLADVLNKYFPS